MKALAIDSAISKITISAKNDDFSVSATYNIGMKQSETLLPAIDYVLKKANLQISDLDYLTLTKGPGSFTGLRLSFSALKAIQLSKNIPLYGISTLDTYIHHYSSLPFTVICAIDAKKDRFYSKITKLNNTILEEGDYTVEEIYNSIKDKEVLICGPDSLILKEKLLSLNSNLTIYCQDFNIIPTESLFTLTEKKIANNDEQLKDFEGPVYLRASEAELNLSK